MKFLLPMCTQQQSPQHQELARIVTCSPWLMSALQAVRSLQLQSWCIGAGAVRNLVWDALHDYKEPSALTDVDVVYFDLNAAPDQDKKLQQLLHAHQPTIPWEVVNQAFVHTWFERYFDHSVAPVHSLTEAVATWPEFATSVGVSLDANGQIDIIAPYGLDDLFAMRVQRNPSRVSLENYQSRVEQKQYAKRWPRVTVVL
jgi:hypothetical protein